MDPETTASNPAKPIVKGYAKNRVAHSLGLPIGKETLVPATMSEDNTAGAVVNTQETLQLKQDAPLDQLSLGVSAFSKSSLLDFSMTGQEQLNENSLGSDPSNTSEEGCQQSSPKPASAGPAVSSGSDNENDYQTAKQSVNDDDDLDLETTSVSRKPVRNNRIFDDEEEALFVETEAPTEPSRKKPAISNVSPEDVINNAIFGSGASRANIGSPPQRKEPVVSNTNPDDAVYDALHVADETSRKKKQSNKVSRILFFQLYLSINVLTKP